MKLDINNHKEKQFSISTLGWVYCIVPNGIDLIITFLFLTLRFDTRFLHAVSFSK